MLQKLEQVAWFPTNERVGKTKIALFNYNNFVFCMWVALLGWVQLIIIKDAMHTQQFSRLQLSYLDDAPFHFSSGFSKR